MKVIHKAVGLLAIGMLSTSVAGAQVSYTTTGWFTGGANTACTATTQGTASATASCKLDPSSAAGIYTLAFQGAIVVNQLGAIDFGTLDLTDPTNTAGNLTLNAGDLIFNMMITQTNPSNGQQVTVGSVSGQILTGGVNSSTLMWVPTPSTFSIGIANYSFNFDNSGVAAGKGYVIPLHGSGIQPSTTLKGNVTTTPEPGSIALFATGLAGLIPVAIRRRKSAK